MSAELLRTCAALMRERAEAAASGLKSPWVVGPWGEQGGGARDGYTINYATDNPLAGLVATCADYVSFDAADHIASWHPAVALAVADWLEGVALYVEARDDEEYFDLDGDPIAAEDTHAIGSALAVARAYLDSPT